MQTVSLVIKKIKDAKMAKYWKENQEGLLNDGEALTILMMLYNEHPYVAVGLFRSTDFPHATKLASC
ncbi:hypothetical protein UXQ40_13495 (plasmid) [Staphylococcus aureus]|uniref:Uncharacterized protein n=1 Tax=Staphylococcus aureus TaxID=1280 RepID=A0A8F8WG64_STAAU|nr:hypothetical protein [Staphylococcus aureus]QYA83568.1 hypothetical protein KZO20_00005 [Staphylococcus aureus]